jgi:hypothetical protein
MNPFFKYYKYQEEPDKLCRDQHLATEWSKTGFKKKEEDGQD